MLCPAGNVSTLLKLSEKTFQEVLVRCVHREETYTDKLLFTIPRKHCLNIKKCQTERTHKYTDVCWRKKNKQKKTLMPL